MAEKRINAICFVLHRFSLWFFFFQAEDGIRDDLVTGVQTCALPISRAPAAWRLHGRMISSARMLFSCSGERKSEGPWILTSWENSASRSDRKSHAPRGRLGQIGRASCRERV